MDKECNKCGYYEDNVATHYEDCLIERINQFNEIKYGSCDNETRIIFATLKPEGTVTTAPKYKGVTA